MNRDTCCGLATRSRQPHFAHRDHGALVEHSRRRRSARRRRKNCTPATQVLLDGYNGLLIVRPERPETLWEYGELESAKGRGRGKLTQLRETKSTTRDGRHVVLSANIELPDEVDAVMQTAPKASAFIGPSSSTSTASSCRRRRSNYETYLQVAQRVATASAHHSHASISAATSSLRASKPPEELNPFLGWRAIRFCLEQSPIFSKCNCAPSCARALSET